MQDLVVKAFQGPFHIQDEANGEVEAVVATLGRVDNVGDVILPGAVDPTKNVWLSTYGHSVVLDRAPPVGVGRIREDGNVLLFEGRLFLTTDRGRDAFATLREMGPFAEWSFAFPNATVKVKELTDEWRAKGARRLLVGIEPVEASPVLIPAGHGTRTLAVKSDASADEQAEVRAIHDHVIARQAQAVLARARELQDVLDRQLFQPPTTQHGKVARFTATIAARLLHSREVPRIAWVNMAEGDDATGYTDFRQPDRVFIARDLAVAETVQTVLHECKHVLTQQPWEHPGTRERFAAEFDRKWSHAVFRAGTTTDWDATRVHIADHEQPSVLPRSDLDIRKGDVMLCRGSQTAWRWSGYWTAA
jgi:hypothetical protein